MALLSAVRIRLCCDMFSCVSALADGHAICCLYLGWIYDITHSYTEPFIVTGVCIVISGAILFFLPLVARLQRGSNRKKQEVDMGVRIAVDTVEEVSDEEAALNDCKSKK